MGQSAATRNPRLLAKRFHDMEGAIIAQVAQSPVTPDSQAVESVATAVTLTLAWGALMTTGSRKSVTCMVAALTVA